MLKFDKRFRNRRYFSEVPWSWEIKHFINQFSPFNIRTNLISCLIGKDLAVIANTKITGIPKKGMILVSKNKKALIIGNHITGNIESDYLIEV